MNTCEENRVILLMLLQRICSGNPVPGIQWRLAATAFASAATAFSPTRNAVTGSALFAAPNAHRRQRPQLKGNIRPHLQVACCIQREFLAGCASYGLAI